MCLVNAFESAVGDEGFRYADAFGCLVVFEQCGDDAWQCECGAVERVAQFDFLVSRAVAAFEPVGLVGVEVGDGADFEPASLCFGIDFEVVADGRGEAHVSSAEPQDAVGEFELAQESFDVVEHFLV